MPTRPRSWKTWNASKCGRTAEGGFSSFREILLFLKTTSKYLHKRNCLLVVFRGAKKSRKSHQIRAFLFDRNQRFSTCDTIFTEIGPRSTKKHIRLCRFFTWIPGKVENGEPRMLCFAVVFLVFWGTLPAFRSQMGPGPGNLPFRTCFHRGFGMEIWGFRTPK